MGTDLGNCHLRIMAQFFWGNLSERQLSRDYEGGEKAGNSPAFSPPSRSHKATCHSEAQRGIYSLILEINENIINRNLTAMPLPT